MRRICTCEVDDPCKQCQREETELAFTSMIVQSFTIRDYLRITVERISFQYWMRRTERRVNRRGISGYRDW